MIATRHAVATTSGRRSASSAVARAVSSFMARSASGVTSSIRRRALWKENVSSGRTRSRARRSAGTSVSIVVFELGTSSPTRCIAVIVPVGSVPGELLRDLPDVAVRVRERGRAHPPLPVDRAVEQLDAAVRQLRETAFASSTQIVNWARAPASGPPTVAGAISSCAAGVASRLMIVFSNWNAAEFSSSKSTGTSKTFS